MYASVAVDLNTVESSLGRDNERKMWPCFLHGSAVKVHSDVECLAHSFLSHSFLSAYLSVLMISCQGGRREGRWGIKGR